MLVRHQQSVCYEKCNYLKEKVKKLYNKNSALLYKHIILISQTFSFRITKHVTLLKLN